MTTVTRSTIAGILLGIAVLVAAGCGELYEPTVVAVDPGIDTALAAAAASAIDTAATLASVRRAGAIRTIVVYGDYRAALRERHRRTIDQIDRQEAMRRRIGCSIFSWFGSPGRPIVGRNFDHDESGVLVGFCFPPGGYASVAVSPMFALGFAGPVRFDDESPLHREILLAAPFFPIDGMNERGLLVTVASYGRQSYGLDPGRPRGHMLFVMREMLDKAGDLDEAIAIARSYDIVDNGSNVISHHLFLADPSGRSAVVEYSGGKMQIIENDGPWQVATNSRLFERPERTRRASCSRYRTLAGILADADSSFGWLDGMAALRRVSQERVSHVEGGRRLLVSTRWSSVYDLEARTLRIAVDRDWDTVYELRLPARR
ncbi:MAG: linear amide C-N hydrolase [Candidatus Krumholzibacteriota bacterium]|nr:linear amide C-N hydrolase [Candidatus Krumholzibacteriota bacterium]